MARSLAVWLTGNSDEAPVELHINYWALATSKLNYLDIGVKIKPNTKFESVNFYFPFSKKTTHYDPSLGKTVCSGNGLLSAIFNSKVLSTDSDGGNSLLVKFPGEENLRFFQNIEPETKKSPEGVIISDSYDGKLPGMSLKFPSSLFKLSTNSDESAYFRFRLILSDADKKSLSHIETPKGELITGHLETTELVDFRVNEQRNIPVKIRENINTPSILNAVHLFLIREASAEYKLSHSSYKRCRVLESELWDKYLESEIKSSKNFKKSPQMLIYHWASKKDANKSVEHFSAFSKFVERKTGWWIIMAIALVIIALGASGSFVASIAEKNIYTDDDKTDNTTSLLNIQKNRGYTNV